MNEAESTATDTATATDDTTVVEEDLLVEEVSIDGMCGVY
ncbi:MAG: mycofactocin precursor MftA [Haloechinothrix sp.]